LHFSRSRFWLLLDYKFLATPIIGIPYLILLVEVLSISVFAIFRRGITQTPQESVLNA
jgi:hypothetical protein